MSAAKTNLTAKQRAFVEHYLATFNATKAAVGAGYSARSAASIGWENLRKPEIALAVRQRLAETALTSEEVLMRLAEQARGSMADFVTILRIGADGVVRRAGEEPGELQPVESDPQSEGLRTFLRELLGDANDKLKPVTGEQIIPMIDVARAKAAGKLHLVRKLSIGSHGISVELYDAQAALTTLARQLGLLGAKGTVDDPTHTVGMGLAEWRAEAEKRRQQAAQAQAAFEDGNG